MAALEKSIPSLGEFRQTPSIGKWFQQHPQAYAECEAHMRQAGVDNTHAYLVEYFDFPHTKASLVNYSYRQGWK